jgi:cytochrome P450 family 142 subfamily A polypeptide 1
MSVTPAHPAERPPIDLLDGHWYASGVHRAYAWMRAHEPVFHDAANGVWALTRHADVTFASKRPDLFCSGRGMRPGMQDPIVPSLINMDDPRHKRRRNLVNRGFTPRRIAAHEPRVRELCEGIVDRVAPRGACEFVHDVAAPLPMILIGDMLGVAPEDRDRLLAWSDDMLLLTTSRFTPEMQARSDRAHAEYAEYVMRVVADRRARPRDDLMSLLVHADVDGERLSDEDLVHESMLILIGGDETTRHVITGGTEALIRNPAARQWLREDPSRIPVAVEEMLRIVSPIHNMARTTTRAVEIGGRTLPAGACVLLMYASANRDAAVFDRPDALDVDRRPNPHVAFGGNGPHFCLGAALARLELRVMFETLLRRLPDLALATDDELPLRNSNFIVGIERMPVVFTPRA